MSVEEEKSESDIFTEAFDTLAKTGEVPAPVEAKAEETPVEAPVEGESDADIETDAAPASDDEVKAEGLQSDEPKTADKAEAPAPKEPQKAATDQDIIDRLAQAVKERVQPPSPAQEPEVAQPYEPPPVLTQEDYKALEAFEKDWPDVAKAMDLRAKEQAHAIVNHTFKEWAEFVKTTVNPLAAEVQELRQWKHVNELKSTVNDYDDIRDKVVAWANNQPDYLRSAYQQVIQRGTMEQVQDLINRYRAENAPPPAPSPVAPPPQKQLSPAVKEAAKKLAPVQSKRSQVLQQDDPNDYEGAFSRFAGMQ